ncbi:MAG: SDR family oxidoreductase [Rikenellaceae bacterium]|nr:SDR family oxidoreductase [Rikenellaceae bacterium]
MIKTDKPLKSPLDKRGLDKFPEQQQKSPGIQEKIVPVPDSGEDVWIGSGRLKGRKALVTGGDSGIGRAIAIAYAREGAQVAINFLPGEDRDADTLTALLEKEGHKLHLLPGDIRDEETARRIVRDASEAMNGIDILVLNAGIQKAHKELKDITTEQLTDTFTVNVFAPFWMVQEAESILPEGASIIFTSSTEFFKPAEKLTEYAASKYAVVGLSRALAKELINKGIRVNTVCPGSTWTPLEISGGLLEEDIPSHGSGSLMNRAAQPYEIAGIYVFLASEEASFATCETYGISGGMETV